MPASRLPAPGHLDLQAAFFAPRVAFSNNSEERWDNAGGLNWGAFLLFCFFFGGLSIEVSLARDEMKNSLCFIFSLQNPRRRRRRRTGQRRLPAPATGSRARTSPRRVGEGRREFAFKARRARSPQERAAPSGLGAAAARACERGGRALALRLRAMPLLDGRRRGGRGARKGR